MKPGGYVRRKPKLGQNFLVDDAARHAIADALGRGPLGTVLEIGPGHGAITSILAPRCGRLVAVELDRVLAEELRTQYRGQANVEIVEADILDTNLKQLLPGAHAEPAEVIGNLPYYVTSDILLYLFEAAREGLLRRAVLMMQREVAERVAAAPGGREYGLLSATAQMHGHVETLFTLPPRAFSPPPEVFSTVIRIEFAPRFPALGVDAAEFDRFLKECFAQKRKTLFNNLRTAGYDAQHIRDAWPDRLGPDVRAESVDLAATAGLFRGLRERSEAGAGAVSTGGS